MSRGLGKLQREILAAISEHGGAPARRCVACLTPVSRPWHHLCRECFAWHLFGEHLRRAVALARLIREGAPR
jgi:hypothetical protein